MNDKLLNNNPHSIIFDFKYPLEINQSDCKKFIKGFQQLVIDCNVDEVTYNKLGLGRISFKDGTYVGALALLKEIGIKID